MKFKTIEIKFIRVNKIFGYMYPCFIYIIEYNMLESFEVPQKKAILNNFAVLTDEILI